MVGLLHAMAFMVLLLIGWVIWNNKPLPLPTLLWRLSFGIGSLPKDFSTISEQDFSQNVEVAYIIYLVI